MKFARLKFQLQMLMSGLIRAFPQQAAANLRLLEEMEGDTGGSGLPHRTRKN